MLVVTLGRKNAQCHLNDIARTVRYLMLMCLMYFIADKCILARIVFVKDNPTGHSERKKKKEADRRRGGKTISKSGQEWTLPAQLGQLKTGQDGKGLLGIHLWCPDDLPRLWDRIE